MSNPLLPNVGPVHLDLRDCRPSTAARRCDLTLRRVRPGARLFLLRAASEGVVEIVCAWAARGGAPWEVVSTEAGTVVRITLLPREFGGHPGAAFRAPFRVAAPSPAALAEQRSGDIGEADSPGRW